MMLKWIRKIILGILISLLTLSSVGVVFEQFSRWRADKITSHGAFADVGNHKLHYYKKGENGPTVVFESAFDPAGHLQWYKLQQELSKFAVTISYDRAGILWSERGDNPKSADAIAEELHTLLEKSNTPKPFILVGHSLGGLLLRSFVAKYPQEVSAVILVESKCPDEEKYMSPELYAMVNQGLPSGLLKFANAVGLARLMFRNAFPDKEENKYLNTLMPALIHKSAYGVLEEQDAMPRFLEDGAQIRSFGDIPLIVLTANDQKRFDAFIIDEKLKAELLDASAKLQNDLLKLSTNCEQILVPNSSHYINEDQPQAIVDAVKRVLLKQKTIKRS